MIVITAICTNTTLLLPAMSDLHFSEVISAHKPKMAESGSSFLVMKRAGRPTISLSSGTPPMIGPGDVCWRNRASGPAYECRIVRVTGAKSEVPVCWSPQPRGAAQRRQNRGGGPFHPHHFCTYLIRETKTQRMGVSKHCLSCHSCQLSCAPFTDCSHCPDVPSCLT